MTPHWEILEPRDPKSAYWYTEAGTFWKMDVDRFKIGRAVLVNGGGLVVGSNNPTVIPNDDLVFKGKTGVDKRRTIEFYCANDGYTLIEARRNGISETRLQVYVKPVNTQGLPSKIQLNSPHAALNAIDTPVKYRMDASFSISPGEKAGAMFKKLPKSLKHLAFSCHGSPGKLEIGEKIDINNVNEFAVLKNTGIKVIWIGGCSVAGNPDGINFCKKIIQLTGCHLVTPGITISTRMPLGFGQIEVFSSSLPHYFDNNGVLIPQGEFFKKQVALDFKVI